MSPHKTGELFRSRFRALGQFYPVVIERKKDRLGARVSAKAAMNTLKRRVDGRRRDAQVRRQRFRVVGAEGYAGSQHSEQGGRKRF